MSDRHPFLSKKAVLVIPLIALFLAACGPESNSRYGDAYWDPWTTKDIFDPVVPPSYSVEYYRTSDEGDPEVFEARITLDASKTNERFDGVFSWGFIRGTKQRETFEPLGAESDLQLVYAEDSDDPNDDQRLAATVPGEYRIFLIGETAGPLGKVTLDFNDMVFSLPGCPTTRTYYEDYVDDTLETCAECHQAGDARAQLNLPTNNMNTRRSNFMQHVEDRLNATGDDPVLTLPEWIVNPSHDGSNTISADSDAYQRIADMVAMLASIEAETEDIDPGGSNVVPDDYCIAKPAGFAFTVPD
jgi:hypothetical protein